MTSIASLRIIVADEDPQARVHLGAMLRAAGARDVFYVGNGEAALRQLWEEGADLIVANLQMPLMNGLAMTRVVRRLQPPRRSALVVITTVGPDERTVREIMEAGADAILVKPVTSAGLVDRMEKVLARRKAT